MKPKPIAPRHVAHHAYLIRLWRSGRAEPWRASLHNALTGERHQFADPIQLFYFLQSQLAREDQNHPSSD